MGDLFSDGTAGPNLREYKIYLSKTAYPDKEVKHDKLVVYYALSSTDVDGSDSVGDRIVSAIEGAVKPADIGSEFAPFYSRISPGIAWAEEPKYFVAALKGSFTESRSAIIEGVIKTNPNVAGKEEFITKVNEALKKAGVDPDRSQRHLVG